MKISRNQALTMTQFNFGNTRTPDLHSNFKIISNRHTQSRN